ncbi:MAG: hypothetical protein ACFFCV_16020 [Promethearchaeota archaeon]
MSEKYSPGVMVCVVGLLIFIGGLIVIWSLHNPLVGLFLLIFIIICAIIILIKKVPEYKKRMKFLKQKQS